MLRRVIKIDAYAARCRAASTVGL